MHLPARDLDTEWEEFQSILREMGIDRCAEIQQITPDEYLGK